MELFLVQRGTGVLVLFFYHSSSSLVEFIKNTTFGAAFFYSLVWLLFLSDSLSNPPVLEVRALVTKYSSQTFVDG